MSTNPRAAERLVRGVRLESLISPDPKLGLVTMESPNDPTPSLVLEDDVVIELDSKTAEHFDLIDRFVVAHGLDLQIAKTAMSLPDEELALMLVGRSIASREIDLRTPFPRMK